MLNKSTIFLATCISFSSIASNDGLGPLYSKDENGQRFVNDVKEHISTINNQMSALKLELSKLEKAVSNKQIAIDYINRVNESRYFYVKKGSFKAQLAEFADQLNIKTIRWSGVPTCIDWELDSIYKIDVQDTTEAINEFLDGMPLTYEFFSRDKSLNLTSTVIIEGCPHAN
jgi:hypothetical protein